MKALADRRARVARVRRVQHMRAVGAAALAEGRLDQLEGNAARLAAVRASLVHDIGTTSGAALGNGGELGGRLDEARCGMIGPIESARDVVVLRAGERLDARIAHEGAERLQGRAVAEMQRRIEEPMGASFRPRWTKGGTHG